MELPEPRLVRAELVARAALSPRVRLLGLSVRGPDAFVWMPGQYVEIGVVGDSVARQPYSIANAPDPERPGYVELAVGVGSGSGTLDDLAVGGLCELFGPRGRFVREDMAGKAEIFVGTGTGIAPLRAMLSSALANGGGAPLLLIFGARSESEILWRDELESLSRREPRFHFEPTLSRPTESWHGRKGRVQDHLTELVAPLRDARVYVCGVEEMVQDCVRRLNDELGFPPEHVHVETH